MTEAEWLVCREPRPMLEFMRGKVSKRKLRLLICACFRRLYAPSDPRAAIIAVGEKYADGTATSNELQEARDLAGRHESSQTLRVVVSDEISCRFPRLEVLDTLAQGRASTHCVRIRDIFGNPFRPVEFDPEWRSDTAVALAQQMYESRDFSTMPILADALQDAGCDNGDVLSHCRDANQVHVRGCWVVDGVLGKE